MAARQPLASIAEDLYALTPAEFTPARNARSRNTKPEDAALAAAIIGLRKPAPAAWLVNQLVRHRRDGIDEALELGAALREAQERLDRAGLQRLTAQRRQLVSALARDGAELAAELGHPVSAGVVEEVAQTLTAAMADAAASAAVLTGRLLRPLTASGFDPVDLSDAVAAPGGRSAAPRARRKPAAAAAAPDRAEAKRAEAAAEAARQAIREADRAVDAAEAALDEVDERIRSVDRRRDDLELDLARAEAKVRDLRGDIAAVDREGRALARDRDKVVRAAEAANDAARRTRGA